ncbi:Zinc metalloproteinase nas-4-like protein [Dinothrombium tinctorium]|uniref:Metalloendopeptidase n=1 Tax=Dinothrombium tinctorium TaxID=1965070 RepID=A0A3S3P5T1_9ACAR|nr:Zinc metalloproteinase nas-4-like protein [Dinothrombium tinctorium]RWS14723.1 Zinc metalloproteinase nas-4-like protein [Dinothrombium tinctorium]RWS14726.1 Zinc metalloproteinase nas-4-like protein [Dinothrombium tinctorium]
MILDSCWTHTKIVHEILHALGFEHEHVRPDRDKYIKILWTNIIPGLKSKFKKYPTSDEYAKWYADKFEYDYHSIMHYSPEHLAVCDGFPTFEILEKNVQIENLELSETDKAKLQYFYNCDFATKALNVYGKYIDEIIGSSNIYCYDRFGRKYCPDLKFIKYSQGFTNIQLNTSENHVIDPKTWHINFGPTPSENSSNDTKINFYLHLGASFRSYEKRREPLIEKCGIFKLTIQDYPKNPPFPDEFFCISFLYKFWGHGEKRLQIVHFTTRKSWDIVFNLIETSEIDYVEWKALHIMVNAKETQFFGIKGYINNGGNIAIDNITIYDCSSEPRGKNSPYHNLRLPNNSIIKMCEKEEIDVVEQTN